MRERLSWGQARRETRWDTRERAPCGGDVGGCVVVRGHGVQDGADVLPAHGLAVGDGGVARRERSAVGRVDRRRRAGAATWPGDRGRVVARSRRQDGYTNSESG